MQLRQRLVSGLRQVMRAQQLAHFCHFGKVLVLSRRDQRLKRQGLVSPQKTGRLAQMHPADQFWLVGHIRPAVRQRAANLRMNAVDPLNGLHGGGRAAIGGGGHKQGGAPQPRLQLGFET